MKTLNCASCGTFKDPVEFALACKRKRGRQNQCRACRSSYDYQRYHKRGGKERRRQRDKTTSTRMRNRQFIREYLEKHPCVRCGFSDIRALDFDHIRGVKRKTVSQLSATCCSIATLEAEIRKCQVLCSNCHRIVTREREEQ